MRGLKVQVAFQLSTEDVTGTSGSPEYGLCLLEKRKEGGVLVTEQVTLVRRKAGRVVTAIRRMSHHCIVWNKQ